MNTMQNIVSLCLGVMVGVVTMVVVGQYARDPYINMHKLLQDTLHEQITAAQLLLMPVVPTEYKESVQDIMAGMHEATEERLALAQQEEARILAEKEEFADRCVANPWGAEALAFRAWMSLREMGKVH